jgi:hypothetical protein
VEAERSARQRRTWNGTSYRIALLTLLLSYLVHLRILGLQYPVPWPDEGSFLWPAIAVQEGNTLFAPELNPDRPVMWMPPGYMVVQGLIFKTTGFSLEWARELSALYMCAAVAMLAAFLAESPARWLHLGLAAIFLHSPILLLAGNLARMEPLVLMVVTGSLLLIRHDYAWPGLALALLAPLIHPNGVYFALGAVAYFAIRIWRKPAAERHWVWGLLWLSGAVLLWMIYGTYVLQNWDTFVSDMTFQITWKRFMNAVTGGTWVRALRVENALPALLTALLVIHAAYRGSALTPLFAFVVPARVLALTALGWSYDVYTALEYFLICCLGVDAVWTNCSRLRTRFVREWHVLACAAAFALAVLSHRLLTSDSPLTRSTDLAIANIDHRSAPAYFEPADAEAVRAYLGSLRNQGKEVIVQFTPLSDALLFWDLEGSGLRFSQPTFHTHPADVYVVHQSRHLSPQHRKMIEDSFRALIPLPFDQWKVIRSRDETERWLAYQRAPFSAQGQPLD